ncbi:MAG: hypothetical protein AB1611_10545 [bacterium]
MVHIPAEAIDDASRITVKVYPCLFSQVVEGLDKLFQVSYGCFGQTTAVTWPNVLALDYLMSTKQVTPEIEMTARQYINQGYQRLLTFECSTGGFDLSGEDMASRYPLPTGSRPNTRSRYRRRHQRLMTTITLTSGMRKSRWC